MDGEREIRVTSSYCTETSEGPVYHRKWRGISCPVKLQVEEKKVEGELVRFVVKGGNGHPKALRDGFGGLVFALPGGGEL